MSSWLSPILSCSGTTPPPLHKCYQICLQERKATPGRMQCAGPGKRREGNESLVQVAIPHLAGYGEV